MSNTAYDSLINEPIMPRADAEWHHLVEMHKDEAAALRAQVATLQAERDVLAADVAKAAGELLIEIPEPGSLTAQLLLANVAMRRERDAARADVERLTKERDHIEKTLTDEQVALMADNARHLETIRALRANLRTVRSWLVDEYPGTAKDIDKMLGASREYEQADDVKVDAYSRAHHGPKVRVAVVAAARHVLNCRMNLEDVDLDAEAWAAATEVLNDVKAGAR